MVNVVHQYPRDFVTSRERRAMRQPSRPQAAVRLEVMSAPPFAWAILQPVLEKCKGSFLYRESFASQAVFGGRPVSVDVLGRDE
jgi:hypothetical protein